MADFIMAENCHAPNQGRKASLSVKCLISRMLRYAPMRKPLRRTDVI